VLDSSQYVEHLGAYVVFEKSEKRFQGVDMDDNFVSLEWPV